MSDLSFDQIKNNVESVKERIVTACTKCGRNPSDVLLLAISKKVPVAQMHNAICAGISTFGENYVQEAFQKMQELLEPVTFHATGPLQRNKAKLVVGKFSLIHTVDRIELAELISRIASEKNLTQNVLVEVNISGEKSKSGVSADLVENFCVQINQMSNIQLQGLMCIGSPQGVLSPGCVEEFIKMRHLKDQISKLVGSQFKHLSMGMSHDFELAIQEGATIVRIGSAIFGKRGN